MNSNPFVAHITIQLWGGKTPKEWWKAIKKKVKRTPSHGPRTWQEAAANFLRHQFGVGEAMEVRVTMSPLDPPRPSKNSVFCTDFGTHTFCILISNQWQQFSLNFTVWGPTRKCRLQIKIPLWHLGNSIIFGATRGRAPSFSSIQVDSLSCCSASLWPPITGAMAHPCVHEQIPKHLLHIARFIGLASRWCQLSGNAISVLIDLEN